MLSSRERVELSLQHKEPDRVPMDIGGRIAGIRYMAYKRLIEYLGINCPTEGIKICPFLTAMCPDKMLLERLGTDFFWINIKGPEYITLNKIDENTYINEWGITVKIVGKYSQRITHPLRDASIEDIDKYNWPDAENPERYKGLKEYTKYLFERTGFALAANPVSGGIFEMAQHLRGLENFFIDLMLNKEFANALLDKIQAVEMRLTERFLEEVGPYVSVVALSDDYASNENLLVSPDIFDEFFYPRYRRFIKMIKSKTNAKVLFHSCGAVYDLIDCFIGMGIDILNPIQPTAKGMEHRRLKRAFSKRISFHGGIDAQYILIEGSPKELDNYIKDAISVLSPGGGYILAPSHHIQYNVPPENILAMYSSGIKYGFYS